MNRRKKIIQILKSRTKKKHGQSTSKNKPKYISKADRAKLEAESSQGATTTSESSAEEGVQE